MKRKKLFLLAVICIVSSFTIISTSFMNYTKKKEKIQKYETYVVQAGDTLWKIAKQYRPNEDPRKVIYEIRKHNGITPIIYPGQVIEIPVTVKGEGTDD
ncbi:LysM peptidoglycan-binding domain-containing protein [Caloramator sp. ALD01]|uniref:cell division suppressor protein YneA n=1 Tax=Caloramator sp. ALD01 TaxID=1031288 RepID=UPI000557FDC9|nr:LysM domain-containing protein [Caloramator sp. ALD01]